jgi:hypothetical protein
MKIGETARLTCTPDYAYGAGGFPAWGIMPNSTYAVHPPTHTAAHARSPQMASPQAQKVSDANHYASYDTLSGDGEGVFCTYERRLCFEIEVLAAK